MKRFPPWKGRLTRGEFFGYLAVFVLTIFLASRGWPVWAIMLLFVAFCVIVIGLLILCVARPHLLPERLRRFLEVEGQMSPPQPGDGDPPASVGDLVRRPGGYSVAKIPDLRPDDLDNEGRIVGWHVEGDRTRAVFWDGAGRRTLEDLGGKYTYARAINAEGVIVGSGETSDGTAHALMWRDGAMIDLGLGGAWDINAQGAVVGQAPSPDSADSRATLWQNGERVFLAGDGTAARGINDHGQVVGVRSDGEEIGRAILWSDGAATELEPLADLPWQVAFCINNRGQVAGMASDDEWGDDDDERGGLPQERAFLWQDGRTEELTMFPGGYTCGAADVNESGVVVGSAKRSQYMYPPPLAYDEAGFVWRDGSMLDLTSCVAEWMYFDGAAAVNDRGQIVAWRDGDAYLLTPLPA